MIIIGIVVSLIIVLTFIFAEIEIYVQFNKKIFHWKNVRRRQDINNIQ
jgi:hypothetical protein